MQSCDIVLRGSILTMDPARRAFLDGFVALRGKTIVGVGPAGACDFKGAEEIGGEGHIVMPGLVNVHAHLVQGCIRGMAEGTTFEERLFGFYYPMTGACDEERSYTAAMPPLLDLVRRGVTTTADDHFTHVHKRSIDGVLRAARETGLRCRMARLILSDAKNAPTGFRETVDVGLAETERVKKEWEDELTSVTASTIGITYCAPEEFRAIWQWTKDNYRQFDIHAPSVLDTRYLAERRGWSGGSFAWMDHEGLLGPNVIAAHAQNLRPGEAELIRARGATIALVPDMEAVLGLVDFQARHYLDHGVACGIGLDGPVVAYGHDLWTAMRAFLTSQRLGDQHRKQMGDTTLAWTGYEMLFGSAELALEMATIGGARALKMDDTIGSLEVGKEADVILIDRRGETHLSPPAALVPNLVYGNGPSAQALRRVYVRGKAVVRDGEHVRIDRREAVRKADALQETLLDETNARRFVRMRSPYQWQ
jgi:5-methylthioadenosine/S-adenosylhomocysteine deaminase